MMMILYCLIWNIFIWFGTFYLCTYEGYSLWWIMLTWVLTVFPSDPEFSIYDEDDDGPTPPKAA